MSQLKTENLFDMKKRVFRRNATDDIIERAQNLQQEKLELFKMYFVEGMTQQEIGLLLSTPHTTIGYRLRRILAELNGSVKYNSCWRSNNETKKEPETSRK